MEFKLHEAVTTVRHLGTFKDFHTFLDPDNNPYVLIKSTSDNLVTPEGDTNLDEIQKELEDQSKDNRKDSSNSQSASTPETDAKSQEQSQPNTDKKDNQTEEDKKSEESKDSESKDDAEKKDNEKDNKQKPQPKIIFGKLIDPHTFIDLSGHKCN